MANALIIVDVQNDFCEGGALAIAGGANVAFTLGGILRRWNDAEPSERDYRYVIATRDHHIDPGGHFSDNPDFATTWPPHCRAGSDGAAFHPNLDPQPFDAVFSKGEYSDGYSGFEGTEIGGTLLGDWLRAHEVDTVEVAGLAADFCVRATALDAVRAGLRTTVRLDLTAAASAETAAAAVEELRAAGCELVGSPTLASG